MAKPVFMLVASYPQSIVTFRGELISRFREFGYDVHVVAPGIGAKPELLARLEEEGVVCHDWALERTGTEIVGDAGAVVRLYLLMRRIRPALVLGYTVKPVIYGTLAAWLAGIPHRYALVTGLGYAFTSEGRGFLKRFVTGLYAMALRRTNTVFFQNPDDERLFRHLGLLPEFLPSVVVNGSGVDLNAFPNGSVPAGAPVFLMIGRLLGDKGVREYADAARRVRAQHPHVRFCLVGWVDSNPDAIAQTELDAWIAEGVLEFLGKLDDVRPAIADSTVYVLPSYREGTPRTVLEAMAMGRPIITTDAPGCRETVVDGENGYLVLVKSVDALVDAMLRFIDDPDLAPRMGQRSRQIAEEKYDVHKVNAVMLREMGIAATGGDMEPGA